MTQQSIETLLYALLAVGLLQSLALFVLSYWLDKTRNHPVEYEVSLHDQDRELINKMLVELKKAPKYIEMNRDLLEMFIKGLAPFVEVPRDFVNGGNQGGNDTGENSGNI